MPNTGRQLRSSKRAAIGQRLRAARQQRNISGKDLARALSIRNDSLSQMELGRQAIPAELLVDWCNELQVTLRSIATGTESGADHVLQELPARYARLYDTLNPHYQGLVLDHLELVARLAIAEGRQKGKK